MIKNYIIDTEIYWWNAINETLVAFTDITEIEYKSNTLYITWENNEEIEILFWEFMNYVIWITNQ